MPLTPQDVVDKQFTVTKLRNGYDRDEVDTFLDLVEAELARLLTDNARLAAAPARPAPPDPGPADALQVAETPDPRDVMAPGAPQEAALRTLLMAQRTADQAVAEARHEAAQAVATARAEADAMLAAAQQRSAQVQQEVDARTSEALARLQARQAELEAKITDLRAFEREYRVRLKAYLESQLRDLDTRGGGGADDAGTGVSAAARTAAVGVMPSGVADSSAARPPSPSLVPAPEPPPGPTLGVADPVPAPVPAPATAPAPAPALSVVPPLAEPPRAAVPALAPAPPAGPPREAQASGPVSMPASGAPGAPETVGPFVAVPSTPRHEQVDDGPEPQAP